MPPDTTILAAPTNGRLEVLPVDTAASSWGEKKNDPAHYPMIHAAPVE